MQFRCRRNIFSDRIEVLVLSGNQDGKYVAEPIAMRKIDDGCVIGDPTMEVDYESAQMLIDELWMCGLRPTEGTGSAGSLSATERHLNDMQKIAMGLLKKDGVVL